MKALQQFAEQERYKQQLLADRLRRIQQQHEQRQKLEDVSSLYLLKLSQFNRREKNELKVTSVYCKCCPHYILTRSTTVSPSTR